MSSLAVNIPSQSKVLIAPLNWGLGHATRCIPIIRALLHKQCEVSIASDGSPLDLLRVEFPSLQSFELPAYAMSYKYGNLATNLFLQLPKLATTYRKERGYITKLQKIYKWDVIISDCRYGIFSSEAKNILVTHQLNIHFDNLLVRNLANFFNQRFVKNFDQIWVLDFEDHRLSGKLSEYKRSKNVMFLGAISRMISQRLPIRYDITVILSGPEPSRTNFEKLLWKILSQTEYKIAWVRGIKEDDLQNLKNIDTYTILGSDKINLLINTSNLVISRTGYTTIMDLYWLDKKAILIPTPGQTEQEYLGQWLKDKGLFTILNEVDLPNRLLDKISDELSY